MEKRLIKRGTNWELYQNGSLIASTFDTDLPTITFSDEVAKELGIVDVEKLGKKEYGNHRFTREYEDGFLLGYRLSYNQCLSDNADKKFTLEDVRKAIELAREGNLGYYAPDSPNYYFEKTENEIIQSLTKEEYFCDELEMEEKRGKCPNCEGYGVTAETVCEYCNGKGTVFVDYQPKITNNSIKVVKIWKTN